MRSYYSLISLLVIIPLLGFETNGHHLPSVHEPIPSPTENRRMAPESLSENLYKSFFDEKVKAYKIDYDSDYIGQSIWISRSERKINAKYFAYKQFGKSIHDRYQEWKDGKKLVLSCSGAYTYSKREEYPTGITVDNGNIVNRSIRDDMDALVLVYATGGIAVSDLDDGDLYLGSLQKRVNIRERNDKYEFLSWAEEEQATVFQSHLLAYTNKLRIGEESDDDRAHRRILTLVKNEEGELFHVIFNIREDVALYDISYTLFHYLRNKKNEVIAMVNLDTGAYDILEVYDEENDKIEGIHGDRSFSIRKATNLITYYYED
jgi:hypothetical protein